MMKDAWLLGCLGLVAVGCGHGSTTAGQALVHSKFPYAVAYDDASHKSVLGEDWRLENYRHRDRSDDIERKAGYTLSYAFDFDNDDKPDATRELPYPDLLFLHRKTSARIEISTLLLDERLADKELRVLVQQMVDSRSGTRSLLLGFGREARGVEKRYATRLLDSSPATLGEQQGLVATIERVDLDQLQLDPQARWQRSRLFLVHAPFDYFVSEGSVTGTASERSRALHRYRVLLVAEYSNTPEDFEAQYPEFLRLLNKTHMMTDAMLMSLLGEPLSRCKGHAEKATLAVTISATGSPQLASASGIDRQCAAGVVSPFAFAGDGATRTLSTQYDFSRPQAPAWLAAPNYHEQRATPSQRESVTTEPTSGPSSDTPVPSDSEPPAPAPTAPPVAPSEAPAPPTTLSPSGS